MLVKEHRSYRRTVATDERAVDSERCDVRSSQAESKRTRVEYESRERATIRVLYDHYFWLQCGAPGTGQADRRAPEERCWSLRMTEDKFDLGRDDMRNWVWLEKVVEFWLTKKEYIRGLEKGPEPRFKTYVKEAAR